MTKRNKITIYDLVVVGLMAAMIFVATFFLKIEIPTPTGATMLKMGNIFCLLAGLLFGGWRGGLAAGIGCGLYDLTDPKFVAGAPLTFLFYFLMAFVCGSIAHSGKAEGKSKVRNAIAVLSGAVLYMTLYIGKNVIVLMLAGSAFAPAFIATLPKLATSFTNNATAAIVSFLIAPALRLAVAKAGIYEKIMLTK